MLRLNRTINGVMCETSILGGGRRRHNEKGSKSWHQEVHSPGAKNAGVEHCCRLKIKSRNLQFLKIVAF